MSLSGIDTIAHIKFVQSDQSFYLFSFQHAVVVKFHRNDRLMRQYRACGIDSFGLGMTCIFYHCTMCTSRHDLVSFAFYAIPIFPF